MLSSLTMQELPAYDLLYKARRGIGEVRDNIEIGEFQSSSDRNSSCFPLTPKFREEGYDEIHHLLRFGDN